MCVCVSEYHIFIHSSVNSYLGFCSPWGQKQSDMTETEQQQGCLHVLAILSNAAMNIGKHISFRMFSFFSDKYPGVE